MKAAHPLLNRITERCLTWGRDNKKEMIELFEYLIKYGGQIISSNDLSPEWINQARASGRMWVDENGFGFVWEPFVNRLPVTEEEVELFEKWFPLKVELPKDLTFESLQKRILEKRQRKYN